MKLETLTTKGMNAFFAAPGLVPDKLRMHVTTVEPGSRSHAAHTHTGVEIFYVLEGQALVEIEDERYPLDANQALALDATVPHGISNRGATPVRYIVIIMQ